jgi:hypothetical protein
VPKARPTQPLLISCAWCDPDSSIPTFRRQAWHDAVDHALDEHREQLLATKHVRRFLRIVNPETGKAARIAPNTSPQEPAPS